MKKKQEKRRYKKKFRLGQKMQNMGLSFGECEVCVRV